MEQSELTDDELKQAIKRNSERIYRHYMGSPVKDTGTHWIWHVPWRMDRSPSLMVRKDDCRWFDNPKDNDGDVFSFFANKHSVDLSVEFKFAMNQLASIIGLSDAPKPVANVTTERKPILPVPCHAIPYPDKHPKRGQPSSVWEYRDENNALSYVVGRFHLDNDGKPLGLDKKGKQKKDFLPCFYYADGWQWSGTLDIYPLYGIEKLLSSKTKSVILCEGEKSADAGQLLFPNHIVMSLMGGAGRADKVDCTPLRGRKVYLWPDNDEPGFKAMQTLARRVSDAGGHPLIVNIPQEWPEGWDFANELPAGADLQAVLVAGKVFSESTVIRMRGTEVATTEYPSYPHIVENMLPIGLSILGAPPKIGKSYFCEDMALCVATGRKFMGHNTRKGTVLYIHKEHDFALIKDRMCQLGWNDGAPDIHFITDGVDFDQGGMKYLDSFLEEFQDTVLIVADTMQQMLPEKNRVGKNAYQSDVADLKSLQLWCKTKAIGLLMVHHTNKPTIHKGFTQAYDELSGSRGITGTVQNIICFSQSSAKGPIKMHIASKRMAGKEYAISKNGVRWEMLGDYDAAVIGLERKQIFDLLEFGPLTPTELASATGKKRQAVQNLLTKMRMAGIVRPGNDGKWQRMEVNSGKED
jgi:hypothetical protein